MSLDRRGFLGVMAALFGAAALPEVATAQEHMNPVEVRVVGCFTPEDIQELQNAFAEALRENGYDYFHLPSKDLYLACDVNGRNVKAKVWDVSQHLTNKTACIKLDVYDEGHYYYYRWKAIGD